MKRGTKQSSGTPAKEPESMDPSIREGRVGTPQANTERPCWAISTLNEEVWALFPETPVEYSDVNGRNTALSVTYDCTALDVETDRIDLPNLLALIRDDARVDQVLISKDDEKVNIDYVLVQMRSNPRTQDNREPFGLADALLIMAEADETEDGAFSDPALHAAMTDGGTAAHTSSDTMEGGGA